MKLNWFERTIYDFKTIRFLIDSREHTNLERLVNAINYKLGPHDEEDYELGDINRLFIQMGIDQALEDGFGPFAKGFYHFMESSHYAVNKKLAQTQVILHSTEIKAVGDLTAMVNEYLEDEHKNHCQNHYQINQNDLLRFFIRKGCEGFRDMPIPKIVRMLQSSS